MHPRLTGILTGIMLVLLATTLRAQTVVVGDTLTVHIRIVPSIRDSVAVRDSLVIRDSVVVHYDTVRVEIPVEPGPAPDPQPARDSIIAWQPIIDPPERERTMAVGDTVRVTIVGANVTAITPDGRRVTRAATLDEIRAAGFRWIHSGMGARRDEAPDGTAVTFVSTGLYGSRITHLTLSTEQSSNLWRMVITNVPGEGQPEPEPEPEPEPQPEPEPEPCDDCPEPPPLDVADSLATAVEFDGQTIHEAGISYRPNPQPSYACARILSGVSASVEGDTIHVIQSTEQPELPWCIPRGWPAVTTGDAYRARTYPAEPPL